MLAFLSYIPLYPRGYEAHIALTALFSVTLHLHYNVIKQLYEEIPGRKFEVVRNCLACKLDYTMM